MARIAKNGKTAKINAVIPIELNQKIEDFREMKQDSLGRKVLKHEAIHDFLEYGVSEAEKAVLEENFVDRKIEE